MSVRASRAVTNGFCIDIDLHQGSTLSHFLFTLVVDVLTRGIQDELLWCILFTDDIVLMDMIRDGVNNKLER